MDKRFQKDCLCYCLIDCWNVKLGDTSQFCVSRVFRYCFDIDTEGIYHEDFWMRSVKRIFTTDPVKVSCADCDLNSPLSNLAQFIWNLAKWYP